MRGLRPALLVSLLAAGLFVARLGPLDASPRAISQDAAARPAPPPSDCAFPLPLPTKIGPEKFEKLLYAFVENECYAKQNPPWAQDKERRDTGPYILGDNYGTHPAVHIWYSPGVFQWMKDGRTGDIADGQMIVKVMFDPPASANNQLSGWTTMVRDRSGAWDGWYWSYHAPGGGIDPVDNETKPVDPTSKAFLDARKAALSYPDSGFGQYCVNCHGSTDNELSTYSSLRNLTGDPLTYLVVDPSMPDPTKTKESSAAKESGQMLGQVQAIPAHPHFVDLHKIKALLDTEPIGLLVSHLATFAAVQTSPFVQEFERFAGPVPKVSLPFPVETWDHVVSGPRPKGPQQFITSDQCIGCHDATQNMAAPPNMIYPAGADMTQTNTNLAPYGEWRASMMGLAGRDPVFYSQIESELQRYPTQAGVIQNLCFRCHGVMGQRQLQIDKGPKAQFETKMVYAVGGEPGAEYGALAREGVSCTSCHHIAAQGLGKPETFTGQFNVGPPETIYGPDDKPVVLPMKNALGMTPEQGHQVKTSALCGSCHTIYLPVFNKKGETIGHDFEQATYLEWLNSVFQDEKAPIQTAQVRSCQSCHMPGTFQAKGYQPQSLAYRIASIEDNTFPLVDGRAPDSQITLPIRDPYSRHTLLGMNIFVLEMFNQFSQFLGVRFNDPMATYGTPTPGLTTAIQSARDLADGSATIGVSAQRTGNFIQAKVRVQNLAGHSFPSGVEFRRAYVDFEMLDTEGRPVWTSGYTSPAGVILDGPGGKPLPSEFFVPDPKTGQQAYQPHYETINAQNQVQIYEELVKDPEGKFTTSFVSLYKKIKNNKLQPKGWSPKGPYAEVTKPVGGAASDPSYADGSGADLITYVVPYDAARKAATIRVRLVYQTLPPYYLMQRFQTKGPETERLWYLTSHLDLQGTPVEGWKLDVAEATTAMP
ncbi:MAG TPA: hypothetical protein VN783_08885 [Thermoanaerobaculia bacterium]|nr:hypothetical protein [Thermoanaerobaculia bacterium]